MNPISELIHIVTYIAAGIIVLSIGLYWGGPKLGRWVCRRILNLVDRFYESK